MGVSAQQNGSSHFGASHRALHTALSFQLNSTLDLRPVSLRASNRSNALDHRRVSQLFIVWRPGSTFSKLLFFFFFSRLGRNQLTNIQEGALQGPEQLSIL